MKVIKWLTVNSRGSARLTQGKPAISWDEISIFLEINLPNELFSRPRLKAKIDIPEDAVAPELISTKVIENVKEAIELYLETLTEEEKMEILGRKIVRVERVSVIV